MFIRELWRTLPPTRPLFDSCDPCVRWPDDDCSCCNGKPKPTEWAEPTALRTEPCADLTGWTPEQKRARKRQQARDYCRRAREANPEAVRAADRARQALHRARKKEES